MDDTTRRQLLALCRDFYRAHADEFDESRGHRPWAGWQRLLDWLDRKQPLRVLDIGCGNARLASFLHAEGYSLGYVGVDANATLLAAARRRLTPQVANQSQLVEQDSLAGEVPGSALPAGPFDLVALFGVLHHVPGRDWRRALLQAAADRLAPGGRLVFAAWQFQGRERFERRRVAWSDLGAIEGAAVDIRALEPGDALLRFGSDPERPPRYCHHLCGEELAGHVAALGLERLDAYDADGAEGDLNHYEILGRR
jgi:SAM-dependent methyltransferase